MASDLDPTAPGTGRPPERPVSRGREQSVPARLERPVRRTPEREVLVRAARAALAGEPLAPAVLAGADPARLVAEAHRHECAPLLWSALAPDGLTGPAAERLPRGERDVLRLAYHRNGLRNQVIREHLEALLADLARRGVAAMPLKGAVLAFAGYRTPDQRPLGDLDLLVREAEYPAVAETLAAHGYRGDGSPRPAADLPRHAHTVGQVRFGAARVPPVEVHFRLLNLGPPGATEPAWADTATWRLGGLDVPVPAPERFLLHLALHAQQHGYSLLRLFVDLAVHRAVWPVDADRFAGLAREHHLASAAWLSLHLAARLFEAPASERPEKEAAETDRVAWEAPERERPDAAAEVERSESQTPGGERPGSAVLGREKPDLAGPAAALEPGRFGRLALAALWRPRRALALAAPRWPVRVELPRAYLLGGAPLGEKLAWAGAVAAAALAGKAGRKTRRKTVP